MAHYSKTETYNGQDITVRVYLGTGDMPDPADPNRRVDTHTLDLQISSEMGIILGEPDVIDELVLPKTEQYFEFGRLRVDGVAGGGYVGLSIQLVDNDFVYSNE